MLKKNVGTIDRALRIIVGIALIAGYFMNPLGSLRELYLLGIIPFATGIMSSCPLYSIFGISTCPMKKG